MKDINWDRIIENFRKTISLKRTKAALYMAMVLWAAVATQLLVNHMFQKGVQITEAFVKTNTDEMQSSVEIAAEYRSGMLTDEDKKALICNLAAKIGLTIDKGISVWEEGSRSEYYFYKRAKKAISEIKVISVGQEEEGTPQKNYIIVRLSIQDGIAGIDKYKKILEQALEKLEVKDMQVTLKYEGVREENLDSQQKKEVARLLVDELQGEIALEYDEGDMYTVYAYTGMLKEYVTSMNTKINIQVAISYNEVTGKTRITLATPILNDSW
ncbi:putative RNA-binding protein Jag [Anaerotaenia torta]|uniref:YwmB family TATA-box binding protein n=1 Tax=Anaerotaenia torta TaxID=433293 RepID=UPI003D24DC8E